MSEELRSPECVCDLDPRAIAGRTSYPMLRPLVSAPAGDRLHVFSLDRTEGRVRQLSVDAKSGIAGSGRLLPLAGAETAAAWRGGSVLVGNDAESSKSRLLALDADGNLLWRSVVAPEDEEIMLPRLCAESEASHLFWLSASAWNLVCSGTVDDRGLVDRWAIDLGDRSFSLRAAVTGDTFTLLRHHGDDLRVEIVRIVGGAIERRVDLPGARAAASVDLVVIGDDPYVLYAAGTGLFIQRFDTGLHPVDDPESLVLTEAGVRLHSARLISEAGRIAIAYRALADSGDEVAVSRADDLPDLYQPVGLIVDHVAAYDWRAHRTGRFHRVDPPAVFDASRWIGDSLLLIGGEDELLIRGYAGRECGV